MYIDTHMHLTVDGQLREDAAESVLRAVKAGVGKMVQADVDENERPLAWRQVEAHPGVVFSMLGLYPGAVDTARWRDQLDALLPYKDKGAVAIGEIGLDYHQGKTHAAAQREALRLQLEMAAEMNLPVNIHLRDAFEDFLEVLADCAHLRLRGNFHCFTGSYDFWEEANRYGEFSVGLGGMLTFKGCEVAHTAVRIPLERIVLETDAPYLAPVPHRGERNESALLPLVAQKLAELRQCPVETIETQTTQNATRLFNLSAPRHPS